VELTAARVRTYSREGSQELRGRRIDLLKL